MTSVALSDPGPSGSTSAIPPAVETGQLARPRVVGPEVLDEVVAGRRGHRRVLAAVGLGEVVVAMGWETEELIDDVEGRLQVGDHRLEVDEQELFAWEHRQPALEMLGVATPLEV